MNYSKAFVLTILLVIPAWSLVGQENDYSEEDNLFTIFMEEKVIIGGAAGYSVNGVTLWQKSLGMSDEYQNKIFTSTTLTRIASIAKPMTAIAIMQLVDKGLLQLDSPITDYIPNVSFEDNSSITLRHLLAHRSGIDAYKKVKEMENTKEYEQLSDVLHVFKNRDLKFEPGTDYFYTSYGYVVLGVIIEEVSGLTFEEYMIKNVWRPIAMNDTGVEHFDENYENKSQLYHHHNGKSKKRKQNNLSNRIPAGGLYSTLEDLLKFGNAILQNKLISETSLAEMVKIQSPRDDGNPYGLGWFLYGPHPHENLLIGHSGEQTGCSAQIFINRKRGSVVVTLTNTSRRWPEVMEFIARLHNLSNRHTSEKGPE